MGAGSPARCIHHGVQGAGGFQAHAAVAVDDEARERGRERGQHGHRVLGEAPTCHRISQRAQRFGPGGRVALGQAAQVEV